MKKEDKNKNKELSLIVLYSDSNKNHIDAVLASIYSQEIIPKEIILLDNSKKGVKPLDKNIKIVKTKKTSRAKARNTGVKNSKEDILVFLDGDTILGDKNIFEKIKKYSKKFSHGYGARRMWTYPKKYFESNKERYISELLKGNFEWILKKSYWPNENFDMTKNNVKGLEGYSFPGNFGFASRKLFNEVGGFDERFKGYGGEDDLFAYKLYMKDKKGFKNLFEIRVIHINHPMKKENKSESIKNWKIYKKILNSEGVDSFNIEVLFNISKFKNKNIIKWLK